MEYNKRNKLNSFKSLLVVTLVFICLTIGSLWYILNFKGQVAEKEKIEIAERRINDLNLIYTTFLKSVRENRGYLLYGGEKQKNKYYIYRDITFSLISRYKKSANASQDSLQFAEVAALIQKRTETLDRHLLKRVNTSQTLLLEEELQRMDSVPLQLEQKHAALIAFWSLKSKTSSNAFDVKNSRNNQLFFIWVLFTIFLAFLFEHALRKKIRSQVLQQLTSETLHITRLKEQEFSAAFDYAAIGMALVSVEGKWLRVNKSLCNILGYSEEELLKQKFQDITHPDDLDIDLNFVEQMLKKEIDTYQMEKRYYTKDGRLVWVLLSVSLVWENEKPKYFISQVNDITQNKTLQHQLESEKNRLQQVINGTDAGTWEWNVQTGETIFNEKWAQIIGYTLEELTPISIDTWIKFAHPDDLVISNQKLQDCFEGKTEQYECTCRMQHKSGEWIWVMDRGKVMSWTIDGKPEWMFGSHINITRMKQLEETLQLERNKFSTIFNSTFQFIGFLDLDGTLLEANETALNFAGLVPSDVIGKKFWDCYWWQVNEATKEQLKEAIQKAAKGENISYEVAVLDKYKKTKTILFHLNPLRDQNGKIAYIIPEGTLIQELIDYRTLLESKNQELKGFAAVAAHDLKEPLRMINQFMERLAQKYENQLDEMAQKYIQMAADGAKRMNNFINDLLAYAEVGGANENSFEIVNMNEVVEETISLKAALIQDKNALINKTTLPEIRAHKTAMRLLMQNLIGNGLKYQKQGNQPIIEIKTSENNNQYTFSIKDNGIGIARENHSKVFDLFSRLNAKSEFEGTGMGLATCKKIVTLHGGEIWLESEVGKGSTFFFTIPKNKPTFEHIPLLS